MARIVYKEGLEGQNRLECIEGIEIELLNGQKALIYPKYAEREYLEKEKICKCNIIGKQQIEALMLEDSAYETGQLFALNSPAAMWVNQFHSDEHDTNFCLPSLLAAMELQHQKNDIDELAETIEGADLLRDFDSVVWSCSRSSERIGWVAIGNSGFASTNYLYYSYLAVPTILFNGGIEYVSKDK